MTNLQETGLVILAILILWLVSTLIVNEWEAISRGLNWLRSANKAARGEGLAIYAGYCYLIVGFVVLGIHGIAAIWEWL